MICGLGMHWHQLDHMQTICTSFQTTTQFYRPDAYTGQLLCYRCMQAIAAYTVIAYITHDDDRPKLAQCIISVKPVYHTERL